jgi:hypothetical protein
LTVQVNRDRPPFRKRLVRQTTVVTVQGSPAAYEVTPGEVEALRVYVLEQAGPEDAEAAERLLGQLAALSHYGDGNGSKLRFTPVPQARTLAARALEALRTEGDVRMGSRRWRLQRSRPSRASKRRFAPGRSPGDGAS